MRRWNRILAGGTKLLAVIVAAAFIFAWSGVYNVAASRGHFAVVDWLLRFAMENSVKTHAPQSAPPDLTDKGRIVLGAAHFHGVCADCHGAPGVPINPAQASMLPSPPPLNDRVLRWTPQELFFIVKHGIKYTGMPAWPTQTRDDEVWSIVAFLRQLPSLDEQTYRMLAIGSSAKALPLDGAVIIKGAIPDPARACARCHGDESSLPTSAFVPRLHGQPRAMLEQALVDYAEGRRRSGFMQPPATELSRSDRLRAARYYADLQPPSPGVPGASGLIAKGRRLAEQGDAVRRVPECLTCHGPGAHPLYPRLAAQNAAYMASRLRAWKNGDAPKTQTAAIMAPIAMRLDDQSVDAVVAYFESISPADLTGAQQTPPKP